MSCADSGEAMQAADRSRRDVQVWRRSCYGLVSRARLWTRRGRCSDVMHWKKGQCKQTLYPLREGAASHRREHGQTLTLSRHTLSYLHHVNLGLTTQSLYGSLHQRVWTLVCAQADEMDHPDPHQRPPNGIRDVYKKYQKMKPKDLDQDPDIIDLSKNTPTSAKGKVRIVDEWSSEDLTAAFRAFSGQDSQLYAELPPRIPVYEHADMPGKG